MFKINKILLNHFVIRHQHYQSILKPRIIYRPNDVIPVFRKALEFVEKTAFKDELGSYSYGNLIMGSNEIAKEITGRIGSTVGERVLFLCPNNAEYVMTQWGCWISGQIAVPVSQHHPPNLLEYYGKDCKATLFVTTSEYVERLSKIATSCGAKLLVLDDKIRANARSMMPSKLSDVETGLSTDHYNRMSALILYTSGTTGNPKGVVLTHRNLYSQAMALIDAWKWSANDTILHTLPLNHVHGTVNALLCPLYVGAKCIMLPKFDADTVWSHLLGVNDNPEDRKITIYMAVPTIYIKLIEEYDNIFAGDPKMTEHIKNVLKNKVRLMVSGSAPLPVPVYEKWLEISGHRLLERYGMTEIGMCLSQQYDSDREPGYVGVPLPGVTVRLVDNTKPNKETLLECTNKNGNVIFPYSPVKEKNEDPIGELQVKGASVFREYFNKPKETETEFTQDGWFKTGDICQYFREKKLFKILGRSSTDIIKTGGYKVSALNVETILLEHPEVTDCAVVGLQHQTWGEIVAAVVVLKPKSALTHISLMDWAKAKMPNYWIPREIKLVLEIPKNAMGKVNKKELVKNVFYDE